MKDQLKVLREGRAASAAFILSALLGQALALGLAAISTRDAFVALRGDGGEVLTPVAFLGLAGLGGAALQYLARVEAERLGYDFAQSLRSALYLQYARMPVSEIARRRMGALSLRFVGDLTAARGWAGTGMTRAAAAVIILPAAAACLWHLNPPLALMAAPPVLLSLCLVVVIGWRQEQRHRGLRQQRARIASSMMERVTMAPQLDLLGRTEREVATLESKNAELAILALRRIRPSILMRILPDIGLALAGALMFVAAARSGVDAADVAGALAALAILARPLRDLGGAWDKYCAWQVAREKCETILNAPVMNRPRSSRAKRTSLHVEDLEMNGRPAMTFDTGETGIHHFDQRVEEGMVEALAKLDEPETGRVTYLNPNGGVRRPRLSLITTNAPVLSGSLRRGLTLGALSRASDKHIERVARRYGLEHAMDRLGGVKGRIGENGAGLSAEEKLRLLFARAALTSPNFVLAEAKLLAGDVDASRLLTQLSEDVGVALLVIGPETSDPTWLQVKNLRDTDELEIRCA